MLDCKAVGLVVVVGEFPLGGAGSGVVGSVAERRRGKAYARLVAGSGGAKVQEVVEEQCFFPYIPPSDQLGNWI